MRIRSFRLKLILLNLLLSGGVLLGFGGGFLHVADRLGIERIDVELRALAETQLRTPRPALYWRRWASTNLPPIPAAVAQDVVARLSNDRGELLFESDHWPAALQTDRFPRIAPDQLPPPPSPLPAHPLLGSKIDPSGPPPPAHADRRRRVRPRLAPVPVVASDFATLTLPEGRWRAAQFSNGGLHLWLARRLSGHDRTMDRFRAALVISVPAALGLIGAVGFVLATQALRPVRLLTRTAASVTAAGLDRRIPATRVDAEFDELIDVFNRMLDRLERSFTQATRFSADASHELKTPLAILQGDLELALQQASDGSPDQQTYAQLLEEVQRLKAIVSKLLLLSRADAGRLQLSREPVDLSQLATTAAEDVEARAPDVKLRIQVEAGLVVIGDPDLLQQVMRNLIDNAIKYNQPGGTLEVEARREPPGVTITVRNTTGSLGTPDPNQWFERFYRASTERNRTSGGSGLGLSLAREIARAHGGDVRAHCSEHYATLIWTTPSGSAG